MKRLMTMLLGTALALGTVAFAQEKAPTTPPSAATAAKPARTRAAKPARARAHKAKAAKAKAKPATVKTHKKTRTTAKL